MEAAIQIDTDRLARAIAKLRAGTVVDASGCHLWTGYVQPNGYGWVNVGGLRIAAHRLALIAAGLQIPEGYDACHHCDVRACVNVEHLYVGTRRQNMADCTARDRHNKPRGERHWGAKLSADQVVQVRALYSAGRTQHAVAQLFSINPSTVSRIVRREWRKEVA